MEFSRVGTLHTQFTRHKKGSVGLNDFYLMVSFYLQALLLPLKQVEKTMHLHSKMA